MASAAFFAALTENWNDAEYVFGPVDLKHKVVKKLWEVLNKVLLDQHHIDTCTPQYYMLADLLGPRKEAIETFISCLRVWNFPDDAVHVSELHDNIHIELPPFGDDDPRLVGFPTSWTLECFHAGPDLVGYFIRFV